jgi:hypothetical protein
MGSIFVAKRRMGLQPECDFPRVLFTVGSNILYSSEHKFAKQVDSYSL